ncbi:MAG: phosphoglycerate mutase family protein [Ilumatobacteraceae bacterium]
MTIYLVRHAKAGSRNAWTEDDRIRPLNANGVRQAEAIAARLAAREPTRLLSSPYLRCMQTLEPLGAVVGVEVEVSEPLEEGNSFEGALALIASLPDHSVLCSHGDVIPEVLRALERRGAVIDGDVHWKKGSVWTLERRDGQVTSMHVWWPPKPADDRDADWRCYRVGWRPLSRCPTSRSRSSLRSLRARSRSWR